MHTNAEPTWIFATTTKCEIHINNECFRVVTHNVNMMNAKRNPMEVEEAQKKRKRCIRSNVQIEFNNYTKGNVKTFWRQFINTRTNYFIMYSELPPISFFSSSVHISLRFVSFLSSSLFSCFICLIDKCIRTLFSFNKSGRFWHLFDFYFIFCLLRSWGLQRLAK